MSGLFTINLHPQKLAQTGWHDKVGAAQQSASLKRTFGAANSENDPQATELSLHRATTR